MTSVLNVDTIAAKDGTSPVELTKQSAAKAWANFNSTGTLAIRSSINIDSILDNGVGDYTANFINSMSDADYAPNGSGQNSANTAIGLTFNPRTLAASNFAMDFRNESAGARDGAITTITTNGDLA
jgi:hypothetical protein